LAGKLTDAKQIVVQLKGNVHKAAQAATEKEQKADVLAQLKELEE